MALYQPNSNGLGSQKRRFLIVNTQQLSQVTYLYFLASPFLTVVLGPRSFVGFQRVSAHLRLSKTEVFSQRNSGASTPQQCTRERPAIQATSCVTRPEKQVVEPMTLRNLAN